MEDLQNLEAALRKRIENRSKQLALANDGPWPALVISEPVTAAVNEKEIDNDANNDTSPLASENNQADNDVGVGDAETPAADDTTQSHTQDET